MPAIKVDPPPVNMSIVDLRTGKPTKPFVDFMHRLWKRTGGEQDAIDNLDSTNAYPFFRPAGPQDPEDRQPSFVMQKNGASREEVEEVVNSALAYSSASQRASQAMVDEAISNLSAMIAGNAPRSDLIEAIETLRTVTLSEMAGCRSEIGELRAEVNHLSNLVVAMAFRGTQDQSTL